MSVVTVSWHKTDERCSINDKFNTKKKNVNWALNYLTCLTMVRRIEKKLVLITVKFVISQPTNIAKKSRKIFGCNKIKYFFVERETRVEKLKTRP